MPQIRCPNCGTTINLANRRETDFNLITDAAKKKPRTFTELLHITRLPRKTLSLRLKELCVNGDLLKREGAYESNGVSQFSSKGRKSIQKFPRMFHDRRVRTGVVFIALLLSFSASGYVLAMMFTSPPSISPTSQPSYIGTFEMDLKIYNTADLFAWQAMIHFNQSELVFVEAVEGNFLNPNALYGTIFLFVDDTDPGELLVYGSLKGMDALGVSGTGTVATITFGYKSEAYVEPKIVYGDVYETYLLDTNLDDTEGTLKIELKEG